MGNSQNLQFGKYIGDEREGETRALRNIRMPDGPDGLVKDYKGRSNLKEIFEANVKSSPHHPLLGSRRKIVTKDNKIEFGLYEWKSFSQVSELSNALANYLIAKDLCPKLKFEEGEFRFLSLYAKNREEWAIADLSCIQAAITTITLYDTLGKESIEFILEQGMVKTVVCESEKVINLIQLKKDGKLPHLTHVIYIQNGPFTHFIEEGTPIGLTFIDFYEAINKGKELHGVQFDPVTADTFYTFSYTSGTTGLPKGVMLTHRNFAANIGGIGTFDGEFDMRDDDVYISYLPLAHSLERFMWSCCFAKKLQYGFFQGDILKLREDLAVLKPTIMVSVPRLYNKFYDVMQQRIHQLSGAKRNLIDRAVKVKLENLAAKAETTHKFYDCLVFKNFKAVFGGRVRVLVTGSAPISKDVLNFLKIAFCCPILEGYGQTESCAPATITWIKDPSVGHVGAPFPPLDIKLVDVPEMEYLTSDRDENGQTLPRGEVCYRGHCAFKGYFRQPDQTEETIDRDGWVHTGDIGVFQQNGTVRIIDRKKNIFKLSQGEYIAPDKIEGKITQSIYIAQAFVYGDSLQSVLVAIVVPDQPVLEKWATENSISGVYSEIIKSAQVTELLLGEIKKNCRESGCVGFEIPARVHVTGTPFSVDNDLLTPTFKLKRNEAKAHFINEIKAMYNGAKLQGE